ncbi:MAG: DUF1476 domain-containing protein [Alphaproteobacteria bacterium]|nr:DUF1476 domain-containing protein [Alphaproteobacteria bacterium]
MTQFDSREKSFEKKFEMDEEREFKVLTRAARLFGLWAAEQMGFKGLDAETYAGQAVDSVMARLGEVELVIKIEKDLLAKGIALTRHRLEKEMEGFYQAAQEQVGGA